jgi:hypothetical protein
MTILARLVEPDFGADVEINQSKLGTSKMTK